MKKRFLVAILALIMAVSVIFTACQKKEEVKEAEPQVTETPAEEKKEETTPAEETKANPNVSSNGVDYFEKYGIINNEDSITLTDDLGETVTIKKNPKKVMVFYNSFLELWTVLGGDVVGIIEQSPDNVIENLNKDAVVYGDNKSLNLEMVVSEEPDLIIQGQIPGGADMAKNMKELGLPVLFTKVNNRDDYYRQARIFSAIIGDEAAFEKHVVEVDKKINEIISKVPQEKNPEILLMMATTKGVSVKNSASSTGEIIKDLNAVNIADIGKVSDKKEEFSLEKIVDVDPQIIFMTEMGDLEKVKEKRTELLENDPVWSSLTAVKEGKYHILPKDLYTFKPNHRYAEAYEIIAKYLYPEVFE